MTPRALGASPFTHRSLRATRGGRLHGHRDGRHRGGPFRAALCGFLPAGFVLAAWLLAQGLLLVPPAAANPGDLDEWGGHFTDDGVYHYHKPARDMALRKAEVLEWERFPIQGTIRGVVERIDESAAIWLRVAYRPAYQELVAQIAPGNRDDERALLRVDLSHVSPEETGALSPRFRDWFRQKVERDLKRKLLNSEVSVQFEVVGGDAGRLRGIVFQGPENVNVWVVRSGLSYYLLADGKNPFDRQFREAEADARSEKAGIWEHVR